MNTKELEVKALLTMRAYELQINPTSARFHLLSDALGQEEAKPLSTGEAMEYLRRIIPFNPEASKIINEVNDTVLANTKV